MAVADGLLVDIRNVSNRGVQFNANLEPLLAFGIVPIAVIGGRVELAYQGMC